MEVVTPTIAVTVNHFYRVIFVHIPKNAGTTIKTTFFPRHSSRLDINRSKADVDKGIAKYRSLGYKTFTVWRINVVDRFKTAFLEDVKRVDKDCCWMKQMEWYKRGDIEGRFFTYLSEAERYGGFSHGIKQVDAVRDHEGNIRDFDYNFTMESVQQMSAVLFDGRIIDKKQSNQNRKQRITHLFSSDVIDRVDTLYRNDTEHIANLMKKGQIWKN